MPPPSTLFAKRLRRVDALQLTWPSPLNPFVAPMLPGLPMAVRTGFDTF